jgi:hypothetical protein
MQLICAHFFCLYVCTFIFTRRRACTPALQPPFCVLCSSWSVQHHPESSCDFWQETHVAAVCSWARARRTCISFMRVIVLCQIFCVVPFTRLCINNYSHFCLSCYTHISTCQRAASWSWKASGSRWQCRRWWSRICYLPPPTESFGALLHTWKTWALHQFCQHYRLQGSGLL